MTNATLVAHRDAYRAGECDGRKGEIPHREPYMSDGALYRLYGKGYVAGRTSLILETQGVPER